MEKETSKEISEQERKETKELVEGIEKDLKSEKRRLVLREMVSSIVSPITSLLAPVISMSLFYLGGFVLARKVSDYIGDIKNNATMRDMNRIGDRCFSHFAKEVMSTMPEVERNAHPDKIMGDNIQRLSQNMAMYITNKARMVGGKVGIGISLLSIAGTFSQIFSNPTVLSSINNPILKQGILATVLGGMTIGTGVLSARFAQWIAEKRRPEIKSSNKELNKKYRINSKQQIATLSNAPLKINTNFNEQALKKLNVVSKEKDEAFAKFNSILSESTLKLSLSTLIVSGVGVLGCLAMGMSPVATSMIVMSLNVFNGSIFSVKNAANRLKENADSMYDQYSKIRHRDIYTLERGNERIPTRANCILLDKVCYAHRYKGKEEEKNGIRMSDPVIQSDKTILIQPGITIIGGASGSGKTTLQSLLRHADDLTGGSISFGVIENGKFKGTKLKDTSVEEANFHIGYCFSEIEEDGQTAVDVIKMTAPYLTDEQIREATKAVVNLELYKKNPDGKWEPKEFTEREFSLGEKSRITFMQAFLSPKNILVFDEPTRGVDKKEIREMLDILVKDAKKTGRTIIYTSHQLDEVRSLDVNQVIDVAPLSDPQKINEFWKTHKIFEDRLPSQLDVYPFGTEEEKDAYIALCFSRGANDATPEREARRAEVIETVQHLRCEYAAKRILEFEAEQKKTIHTTALTHKTGGR